MNYFVHPSALGRVAVCYQIPGTAVASIACDFPASLAGSARHLAERLTRESAPPAPELPPEERRIPKGFYEDQGMLF
jgi:hypothetical protein